MTENNQEIEIKIKLNDAAGLRQKVIGMGAVIVLPLTFEHDVMYDDGKGFFDAPKVLRLRRYEDGQALLTYKELLSGKKHEHLLERTEIQVRVSDPVETDKIIRKLGFFPHRVKEKYAEVLRLDGFDIEFHKLPFIGDYMEIEATEDKLDKILPRLGFGIQDGINNDYTGLFEEFCEAAGIPSEVQQTFEEEAKYKKPPVEKPAGN